MEAEMTLRPMTAAEQMYSYSQSQQISMQTGLIGYLRADMDNSGKGFFSSWNGFRDSLKSEDFKQEFDEVLNELREDGNLLHDRNTLGRYCHRTPDSSFHNDRNEYGFRADTDHYSYLMRVNPNKGEYNLYCYCYVRQWLDRHMRQAEKGIRFITSDYKEVFRIPDGDRIRMTLPSGENLEQTCRYIDDTHLEVGNPDHIAVKYYKDYHSGSAKTLKSIQITLAARLEKFNLASVAALTGTDELELASLGEKKVALFALIPDHDVSFNFLVSMVYSCTFEQLFRLADDKYKGALPVPVHFLMDEFANVSLPDDFDKLLATMRSRNVFVSIIIQNIAQLKNLFEKQWESILGNCDEFLYLGGNETGTHKMIAESYLGKQTIDLNTYGKSSGRSGNYSTNWQITGRELLDAAEVRMLDNRYALLFIRGEMPIMDEKYDLLNHPNVKFTPEKGGAPYVHGGTELSVGSLSLSTVSGTETKFINLSEIEFELLSDEEIEAELLSGGKQNEEHH